jgi:lipoate-protein ligase A
MAENWRVLDTGLRSPAQNIALARALLEARNTGEIGGTLRFLRYTRCALLGADQSAAQELDLEYCAARALAIQRRISGGPPMCLDERQLGWELYLLHDDVERADAGAVSKRTCHAVASALSALGIDARFRAPFEIEVDGRTIGLCGIARENRALLVQGVIYIRYEPQELVRVLRLRETATPDELTAWCRDRVTDLATALGAHPDIKRLKHDIVEAFESDFDVEFREGDITLSEHARYRTALSEVDNAAWVHMHACPPGERLRADAMHRWAGGVLRVSLAYDRASERVRRIAFSGDVAMNPSRTIADLEAALRDRPLASLNQRIDAFFSSHAVQGGTLTPQDFKTVVSLALRPQLAA